MAKTIRRDEEGLPILHGECNSCALNGTRGVVATMICTESPWQKWILCDDCAAEWQAQGTKCMPIPDGEILPEDL